MGNSCSLKFRRQKMIALSNVTASGILCSFRFIVNNFSLSLQYLRFSMLIIVMWLSCKLYCSPCSPTQANWLPGRIVWMQESAQLPNVWYDEIHQNLLNLLPLSISFILYFGYFIDSSSICILCCGHSHNLVSLTSFEQFRAHRVCWVFQIWTQFVDNPSFTSSQ